MNLRYYRWKRLFLFESGLVIGTAFCMKWMEADFWAHNEKFTILGLELLYSAKKVESIFSGLDGRVQTILRYHLYFDFAFMAGVYPGIASLCMMAREKIASSPLKKILLLLALFQLMAWAADVIENFYLLDWIQSPSIGPEFGWYHFVVVVKWNTALGAVLVSVPLVLFKKSFQSG